MSQQATLTEQQQAQAVDTRWQQTENALAPRRAIEQYFQKNVNQFMAALAEEKKVMRWKTLLTMEIYRKPDLARCTPASIVASALEAANLGLEFGPKKHAYLVPRKQKDGTFEATMMPGYMGLIHLAKKSTLVEHIEAQVVRSGDHFDYELGLNRTLVHKPSRDGEGALTHAYAIVYFTNGRIDFEVMTKAQIDSIRKRSAASSNGPWVTDYDEMAKKTAIRRICKRLELGDDLADALSRGSEFEGEEEPADVPMMQMPEREQLPEAAE